jgi:predicted XRE-type DNA-binding protein
MVTVRSVDTNIIDFINEVHGRATKNFGAQGARKLEKAMENVKPLTQSKGSWVDDFRRESTMRNKSKLLEKYSDRVVELNQNLSQKEIAAKLGVSLPVVGRFFQEKNREKKRLAQQKRDEVTRMREEASKKVLENGINVPMKPEVNHDIIDKGPLTNNFRDALIVAFQGRTIGESGTGNTENEAKSKHSNTGDENG